MNSREFITILSETYNESMLKENKPNIKLKFIMKWLDETFTEEQLEIILEKVITKFVPTSVNPCPLIPHIIEILEIGKPDNDTDAKEASSRIVTAISKFGYYSPKEAKEYIGELGWEVVKMQGGWQTICEHVMNDELPTYQAQWRDLAKAITIRKKAGCTEPPKLPEIRQSSCISMKELIEKSVIKKEINNVL